MNLFSKRTLYETVMGEDYLGEDVGLYLCRQFIGSMGGTISAEMDRDRLSIKVKLEAVKKEG